VLRGGTPDWLLRHLGGEGFTLLVFGPPSGIALPEDVTPVFVTPDQTPGALWDHAGLAAARFGAPPGGAVLLRPDQHIAARLAAPTPALVQAARDRAMGLAARQAEAA
jgi:3-(3-hydroxy-phenyl)propionate hydroxylase